MSGAAGAVPAVAAAVAELPGRRRRRRLIAAAAIVAAGVVAACVTAYEPPSLRIAACIAIAAAGAIPFAYAVRRGKTA
jgi:hypothetical protein